MNLGVSKSKITEVLENELKINQRKYRYHKKISDGYYELIQKTQQNLQQMNDGDSNDI